LSFLLSDYSLASRIALKPKLTGKLRGRRLRRGGNLRAWTDAFEHAVRRVGAEPVAARALSRLMPMPCGAEEVLATLRECCLGRGVHLVEVGGAWQFRTALERAPGWRR
jgi:hypothetical protein